MLTMGEHYVDAADHANMAKFRAAMKDRAHEIVRQSNRAFKPWVLKIDGKQAYDSDGYPIESYAEFEDIAQLSIAKRVANHGVRP